MRGQPLLALGLAGLASFFTALASAQEAAPDLVVVPPMPPPPARALTLEQALSLADREASDLEVLRLQVQRSQAAERVAWASILPAITGVLTYQRYDEPIQRMGVGTVRDENQVSGQLVISETLSLRSVSAVRIAEASTDLSRMTLEDGRRLAHGAIGRLFYTVLAARHAAELTRTQIVDALRQWEAARARVQFGAAVPLDADRAEVAALDALRRTAEADAALERAWDQLGEALGLAEPVEAIPSRLAALPGSEEEAIERAIAWRADVRAAQA
ncbi:MAG TPA: TolC family protein, partial [Sandaracinaceae bacterium]